MKKFLLTFFICVVQISIAQAPIIVASRNTAISYEKVETQPIFPGGLDAFLQFVGNNFKTPEVEDLSGILRVTFIIETDGSVSTVRTLNDLGHGTVDEAIRVLSKCPKWTPAEQQGKPVRVIFTLPITINN